MSKKQDKVSELLERGVAEVVVKKDLEKLLRSKKKLKVYLGLDPSSTLLHLGNAVPLRKLAAFQKLGHEVIFLVGSFTALIGDTSDKDAMRKVLTNKEIKENFKTYKKQASKILDFSKAKILYNGDWLGKLSFEDIVKLAQRFTVQQMIERDMYQKRLREGKPIGLHEFLYPLMQGYDSVHMEVDVEIGGSDQLFNMLAGRTLLKAYKNKEKHVLTTDLLEGLDGRKMSKSYSNTVNITDEPNDMFGKIMSLRDDLIIKYFELCTDTSVAEIEKIKKGLHAGDNPRDTKARLAREIVALYHGEKAAHAAEKEFNSVFQSKEKPADIPKKKVFGKQKQADELLVELGLAQSRSEAKRLIEQGGVRVDDVVIKDWKQSVDTQKGAIIQVGKRRFVEIA
ncbi:tyrosine--tRNA ligase [bacterium CG10_46_32]|nr:MAG: tyrosine--tRNA ligase [bacterium CG10_46_32]PIR56036.1 MAG: tyrosine--tRNA ligase [Parcubacteria group bacterium CG10_big_fil_rev_8_21_14_0_10_46_32]